MRLWEYVLSEDREHDLTQSERGRDWAYWRTWSLGVPDGEGGYSPTLAP